MTDELPLRVREVVNRLGVSASTVRRLVADGELEAVQYRGRNSPLYISRASLDAYLQKVKGPTNE